jgi:hypothetical protein
MRSDAFDHRSSFSPRPQLILLDDAVNAHVPIQIAALTKSQVTKSTLVRLLSAVNAQMFRQRRTVGKRFATQKASERRTQGEQVNDGSLQVALQSGSSNIIRITYRYGRSPLCVRM